VGGAYNINNYHIMSYDIFNESIKDNNSGTVIMGNTMYKLENRSKE